MNQRLVSTSRIARHTREAWQVPLAIAILGVLLSLGGDTLREVLRYDRAGLAEGEAWRLLTGHLVHLGWGHLALNLVALGILASLFASVLDRTRWVLVCLSSALAIDVGLYWLASEVEWYVGFSGVLHGVMVVGSLELIRMRAPNGVILISLTIGKLCWEQLGGPLPYSETTSGGPVIIDAHLFGAAGGAAAWLVARYLPRSSNPSL